MKRKNCIEEKVNGRLSKRGFELFAGETGASVAFVGQKTGCDGEKRTAEHSRGSAPSMPRCVSASMNAG